jgi:hypothetical protein
MRAILLFTQEHPAYRAFVSGKGREAIEKGMTISRFTEGCRVVLDAKRNPLLAEIA